MGVIACCGEKIMIMDTRDRIRIKNLMKNIHTQLLELSLIEEKYIGRANEHNLDDIRMAQYQYFAERAAALKTTVINVMKTSAHQMDISIKITEDSIE